MRPIPPKREQAELQQPPSPSACNSPCQMQHDSFLLQIQQADSTLPSSLLSGRKLLQTTAADYIQHIGECKTLCCDNNCCIHVDGGGTPRFYSCPPFAPDCEVYPTCHRPAVEQKCVTHVLPRIRRHVQTLSGMIFPALASLAMTAPLAR